MGALKTLLAVSLGFAISTQMNGVCIATDISTNSENEFIVGDKIVLANYGIDSNDNISMSNNVVGTIRNGVLELTSPGRLSIFKHAKGFGNGVTDIVSFEVYNKPDSILLEDIYYDDAIGLFCESSDGIKPKINTGLENIQLEPKSESSSDWYNCVQISAVVDTIGVKNSQVQYQIEDETIAVVSEFGEVQAISEGSTNLVVSSKIDNSVCKTIQLEVGQSPKDISIIGSDSKNSETSKDCDIHQCFEHILVGQDIELQSNLVFPENSVGILDATSWETSDPNVIEIDVITGKITGKAEGVATITAKTVNGKSESVEVSCFAEQCSYCKVFGHNESICASKIASQTKTNIQVTKESNVNTICEYCDESGHTKYMCATKISKKPNGVGVLRIPCVGIKVRLFTDGSAACDRVDSAWISDRHKPTWIIGDHNYQGFSVIKNIPIGGKAYIDLGNGKVEEWVCVEQTTGYNENSHLTDYNHRSLCRSDMSKNLVLYTCMQDAYHVRQVYFERVK